MNIDVVPTTIAPLNPEYLLLLGEYRALQAQETFIRSRLSAVEAALQAAGEVPTKIADASTQPTTDASTHPTTAAANTPTTSTPATDDLSHLSPVRQAILQACPLGAEVSLGSIAMAVHHEDTPVARDRIRQQVLFLLGLGHFVHLRKGVYKRAA